MLERFVSSPVELSSALADGAFSRADVLLHGVDHSGASYEGRVYVNAPDADAATGRDIPAYLGSYHVFGHNGCFGDVGHCDLPSGPRRPFDLRPVHQLTPQSKAVIVTERLRALRADLGKTITITVVAVTAGDASNEVLQFEELRLLSYR